MFTWARGLCGAPDAPHNTANASSLLAGKVSSDVGKKLPLINGSNFDEETKDPIRITFSFTSPDQSIVSLDSILWKGSLYLQIASNISTEMSKEAFINLLEYAEVELNCSIVVLCFSKNRSDRNMLVRMFMYFGFVILPPNHPLLTIGGSNDTLYMATNFK